MRFTKFFSHKFHLKSEILKSVPIYFRMSLALALRFLQRVWVCVWVWVWVLPSPTPPGSLRRDCHAHSHSHTQGSHVCGIWRLETQIHPSILSELLRTCNFQHDSSLSLSLFPSLTHSLTFPLSLQPKMQNQHQYLAELEIILQEVHFRSYCL